uniref:Medium-chain acyl-CoA ligase ACSF2, mitochondrial n=1 Tax=Timema douglasi TaxID=61478 RepID=A0A7R8Z8T6_TIMDO|nr:unnamed protein product [Timema douglasi]
MIESYNLCAQMQCCHVGTSVVGIVAGLHVGFTLVFPSPKFNPKSSIEAIIQERCSAVFGTPAMYVDLVAKLKVVDKEGKMVPMGSPGELWARGYTVMLGYWGDEAKTRETITADGWLKTGDQVILLESGHCKVVGRLKEAIIRGSDNVFPKEIEEFFLSHPDVVDAQAFGVSDARWGEEMCLYIRPKDGSSLTEEHMKTFCKGKVAEFRIPRYVRFLDDFPRNMTGKVDKKILKEQFLQDKEYKEVNEQILRKTYGRYARPSYWFETGSEPLSPLTFGQLIEWAAEEYADREALVSVYEDLRLTFKEAKEKVPYCVRQADHLAAGFLALGLNPGNVIAVWGFNSTNFYLIILAAARAGLILAKVDPSYQAPELRHCLNQVGAKLLIAAETDITQNYYQTIHSLAPELDHCAAGQLCSEQLPELRTVVMTRDLTQPGAYRLDEIISLATTEGIAKVQEIQRSIQPDDGITIHYTSGTTGSQKAALHSHCNVVNGSYTFCGRQGLSKSHRVCVQMQCCHIGTGIGAVVASLHLGFTLVFPSPRFDPNSSIKAIIQERLPGYGMTEGLGFFASVPEDSMELTFTTVGKAVPYLELKVVDKEGKMVPMGSPGELWVRGYIVMLGYWGDEAKTRETITAKGWLKTGDQVILLESGHCKVVGRLKEAIIRGGDNLFPSEIEELFCQHPDVIDVQAFGVPDPRWGEEMCLYIRQRDGANLTEEAMKAYCQGKVAEFRIPRYVRFLDDFPKNTTGKIDKKKLKEQFLKDKAFKEFNKNAF